MKNCCACKESLLETEFHKCSKSIDGLQGMCKKCTKEYNNSRVFKTKEDKDRKKKCSRCKQYKPATLEFFHTHKRSTDGMSYLCLECTRIISREKSKHKEICADCHKKKRVSVRLEDGTAICGVCRAKRNPEICASCQKLKPVIKRFPDRSVLCGHCLKKSKLEICAECGNMRITSKRLPNGLSRCSRCQAWHTPKTLFNVYVRSASKRGLTFELSLEAFSEIICQPCHYCGNKSPIENRLIGADRIDNLKGYESDNVVPCCWDCNQMKGSKTSDEFLSILRKIIDHQQS